MDGWVNQDAVGVLIPGVGLSPSHAHTLVPFGAVEYCYFRKGGFLVSHARTPSVHRYGHWMVSHCTCCGRRMYLGNGAGGKTEGETGRQAGRGGQSFGKIPGTRGGGGREPRGFVLLSLGLVLCFLFPKREGVIGG